MRFRKRRRLSRGANPCHQPFFRDAAEHVAIQKKGEPAEHALRGDGPILERVSHPIGQYLGLHGGPHRGILSLAFRKGSHFQLLFASDFLRLATCPKSIANDALIVRSASLWRYSATAGRC